MLTKNNKSLLRRAWLRLIAAYLSAVSLSFVVGVFLTQIMGVTPETLFEFSTKRVSYAFPVFQAGVELGVDLGIILFLWNSLAALVTISFLYTAPLFNPQKIELFQNIPVF